MKELMLAALAVCLLPASVAVADGCSNRTLVGTVAVAGVKANPPSFHSSIYVESWDGAGNIQYLESDTNGYQSSGLYYGTGKYTVSSDCIATVVYDGSTTVFWTYYLNGDGKGYSWAGNSGGGTGGGRTELISKALLVNPASTAPGPCTLTTLRGTFGRSGQGTDNGVPFATADFEFYDGAGNATYVSTSSNGSGTNTHRGTATYTITDRCVASVYADGSTSPTLYFVAPDGSAYWWMNNNDVGVVIGGKAPRVARGHRDD